MRAAFEANRRNWDARAPLHAADATGRYHIEAFRAGADRLHPIEDGEIGDVSGLRLLHLQCHIGTDTLSLVRRGALVTGLDFSPEAIRIARGFADELGLEADFVEGSVYDASRLAPGPFDMVYTTWGITCWLPDLRPWAEEIAKVLKPGGRLYFADDHPFCAMIEETDGAFRIAYPYRTTPEKPERMEQPFSYTGDPLPEGAQEAFEWSHPVSDILGALIGAGLRLVFVHEHARAVWRRYPSLVAQGDGTYALPAGQLEFPLALSLMAEKPI